MKNLNLIFRRTHLYLGMVLVPWMFVYAFSAFMLNHGPVFRQLGLGPDAWTLLWEEEYGMKLPSSQKDLRIWARKILEEHDLASGMVGVQRNSERALINAPRFIKPVRVTYLLAEKKLVAEQRGNSWMETFLRLHFRHGYGQGLLMQKVWGVVVDLLCISFFIWVATGLYLWWRIPGTRGWGWTLIGAGIFSFIGLLLSL